MDVFDVLRELVALRTSDCHLLQHIVIHGCLDDVLKLGTALDEAVELLEERGVHDVPAAVGAVLVVLVDEFEAAASLADFLERAQRCDEVALGDLGDELAAF